MQHTISSTSQQYGVVERNNYTLKELEKCMMQYKGASLHLWEEVINYEN